MALLKYRWTGLLLLSFALPVTACDNGIAVISGISNYPPLTWQEDDHLVGASVVLVKKILSEVGIDVQPDEGGPWKRVLLRAQRGELDMLLGVTKTVEREQYLDFIEPALTPSVQSVFVSAERDFAYDGWDSLIGKVGSITLGASFGKDFSAYAKNKLYIEQARTLQQNFEKLKLGRVDYLMGPLMTIRLHLSKEGYQNIITNKPTPLMVIDEYLAIPKHSSCRKYLDHLSKRLRELNEDGSWDAIMEEQFINWFEHNEN